MRSHVDYRGRKVSQLLLCIKGSPRYGLFEGKVYTLYERGACPGCNRNPFICVAELPAVFPWLSCKKCWTIVKLTHLPWQPYRFVPLNDPNACKDEVIGHVRGLKDKEPIKLIIDEWE